MRYLKQVDTLKLLRTVAIIFVLVVVPFISSVQASAATITNRKITLSNSAGDASGVTYTLTTTAALPTTGTPVKSLKIQFCPTTSGCSTPTNFSALSSTLASQPSGVGAASGWTVDATVANELRIVNAANATNPTGNVSVVWNSVHNPQATNTTFYGIITTYSGSDWSTGPLDTGTVALSTATVIQVSLAVYEALTFCTGTSITGTNCATAAGSTVSLGTGSTTTTSSGTSIMAASTNGSSGYSITVNGATLTGPTTITAMTGATGNASSVGSKQFGLNLKANATPSVGTDVTGSGSGVPTAASGYDVADFFKFVSGNTVAGAAGPSNANTFTVSYVANIDGITPPGTYTANITYIATANF